MQPEVLSTLKLVAIVFTPPLFSVPVEFRSTLFSLCQAKSQRGPKIKGDHFGFLRFLVYPVFRPRHKSKWTKNLRCLISVVTDYALRRTGVPLARPMLRIACWVLGGAVMCCPAQPM